MLRIVLAGVVLGACATPFFVRAVPQAVVSQPIQLAPVPQVPVEGYRPIRRVDQNGNALPGDEIRWGDVLPAFRDQ